MQLNGQPPPSNDAPGASVVLRVYDLTRGLAATMSPILLGQRVDGVWHTGVDVFDMEYFFGGGIQMMRPHEVEQQFEMRPVKTLPLGRTTKTKEDFHEWLRQQNPFWTQSTYNLLSNNCNHFSDAVTKWLLDGQGIPDDIVNLPRVIMSTPLGATLGPILQQMQQQMTSQLQAHGIPSLWTNAPPADIPAMPFATAGGTDPIDLAAAELVREISGLRIGNKRERAYGALQILSSLLTNILSHLEDEKYRTVRCQNERVKDVLLRFQSSHQAMKACYFEKQVAPRRVPSPPSDVPVQEVWEKSSTPQEYIYKFTGSLATEEQQEDLRKILARIAIHADHIKRGLPPPGQNIAPTPPTTTAGTFSSSTASASSSFGGGQQSGIVVPPQPANLEARYSAQLAALEQMGFTDRAANLVALDRHQGNINRTIDTLSSGT